MQAKDTRSATIALFGGGGAQAAAIDLSMIDADLALFLDVRNELGNGVSLDERVIPIALAEGESVGSLLAKFEGNPEFTDACHILKNRPGDLAQGLAQTPVLGAMAFQDLPTLAGTMEQVLNQVRRLTNGAPERVRIITLGSNSGGTGRGTILQATKALVDVLHSSTDAVINLLHTRIGCQTFTGLGGHIRGNNAIGLQEDLVHVMSPEYGQREVRSLLCLELPIVGEDKQKRDSYVRLVYQALMAPETQLAIGRREVNLAVTAGAFGRMSTVQAGIWEMPGRVNLTATAAVALVPEIRKLIDEKILNVGQPDIRVSVDLTTIRQSEHQELIDIVARKRQLPADAWERYIQSQLHTSTAVYVTTDSDLPLPSVLTAGLARSVAAFRKRRDFLYALEDVAKSALADMKHLEAKTAIQLEQAKRSIAKVLAVFYPRNLMQWIVAAVKLMLSSRGKQLAQLKSGLEVYARLEERLARVQAEREAITTGLEEIKMAVVAHEKLLRDTLDWLIQESGYEGVVNGLLTFRELDEVFGALLVGRFSQDKERFRQAILKAIRGVTRQGLAMVLGVDDSSSLNMTRVLTVAPPLITPPWGGKRQRGTPREFLVIPPVSEELKLQLQQELVSLGSRSQLLQTETVVGGIAVVAIDVHLVDNLDDIMTTQYAVDREKVRGSHQELLAKVPGNSGEVELGAILEQIKQGGI